MRASHRPDGNNSYRKPYTNRENPVEVKGVPCILVLGLLNHLMKSTNRDENYTFYQVISGVEICLDEYELKVKNPIPHLIADLFCYKISSSDWKAEFLCNLHHSGGEDISIVGNKYISIAQYHIIGKKGWLRDMTYIKMIGSNHYEWKKHDE